ncbi:MAG: thioredoxin domain-containing protein [Methylophilus sp.]|nr:thioredoxin domain-containing protein [Methylophilus sp.]
MLIKCPRCNKTNRLAVENFSKNPNCGACHKPLFSLPIEISQNNFNEMVNQREKPVLVDFWAPWCNPCKSFASTFTLGAEKNSSDVIYGKVNTEVELLIASKHYIKSIPTLIGFFGGKELIRLSGALSISQLQDLTNKLIHDSAQ